MPPPELAVIEGAHRRAEPGTSRWWLIGIAVLGVLAVAAGVLVTRGASAVEQQVQDVTSERDAAVEQASTLADQVVAACEAGGEPAAQLERVGACQQAEQVRATPVPSPGQPPIDYEPRLPTAVEIRAAVDAYMLAHPPLQGEPGRAPTPDEVAAAVTEYMAANPPEPGRPPTAEEIADAVALYFADNPIRNGRDGEDGQPGPSGQPGPPPTEEEIRDAVEAYLREHPIEMTCPRGSSLEDVTFESGETGLGCVTGDAPSDPPADEVDPDDEQGRDTVPPTTTEPPTTSDPQGGQS